MMQKIIIFFKYVAVKLSMVSQCTSCLKKIFKIFYQVS